MTAQYPPSPVPADRDLWPGELPFTAFGQFGEDHLDLRVFDQDIYWVDRLGTPHLLGDIDEVYVHNIINFLLANVAYFYLSTRRRVALQVAGDQLLGRPSGDVLALEVGGPALQDLSPQEWLEATPLMRALRARSSD
jgi:hypothetical protein